MPRARVFERLLVAPGRAGASRPRVRAVSGAVAWLSTALQDWPKAVAQRSASDNRDAAELPGRGETGTASRVGRHRGAARGGRGGAGRRGAAGAGVARAAWGARGGVAWDAERRRAGRRGAGGAAQDGRGGATRRPWRGAAAPGGAAGAGAARGPARRSETRSSATTACAAWTTRGSKRVPGGVLELDERVGVARAAGRPWRSARSRCRRPRRCAR